MVSSHPGNGVFFDGYYAKVTIVDCRVVKMDFDVEGYSWRAQVRSEDVFSYPQMDFREGPCNFIYNKETDSWLQIMLPNDDQKTKDGINTLSEELENFQYRQKAIKIVTKKLAPGGKKPVTSADGTTAAAPQDDDGETRGWFGGFGAAATGAPTEPETIPEALQKFAPATSNDGLHFHEVAAESATYNWYRIGPDPTAK